MPHIFLAGDLIDLLLVLLFIALLILIGSFFVIRDLKNIYKIVFKIRSKFTIELRKIVNLMYKILNSEQLKPFTEVIIKTLPHEQKKILLSKIDEIYTGIDLELEDNKYIIETYENLQKLRRERDAKILAYNHKIRLFPFSIYAKILKMKRYELYTEKN